jgi:hypothetical protein
MNADDIVTNKDAAAATMEMESNLSLFEQKALQLLAAIEKNTRKA